jgi:hypothetical protein
MPRSKKVPKAAEVLAPVPDAILNQFAPKGMLTAADVEACHPRPPQSVNSSIPQSRNPSIRQSVN